MKSFSAWDILQLHFQRHLQSQNNVHNSVVNGNLDLKEDEMDFIIHHTFYAPGVLYECLYWPGFAKALYV